MSYQERFWQSFGFDFQNLDPLLELENQVLQLHRSRLREVEVGGELRLHLLKDGILLAGLSATHQTLIGGAAVSASDGRRRRDVSARDCKTDVTSGHRSCRRCAGDIFNPDSESRNKLLDKVERVRSDGRLSHVRPAVKSDDVTLGQTLPELSQDLFVHVLSKPDHLVYDAFQTRKNRRMQIPLHVHDPGAPPHRSGGAYGTPARLGDGARPRLLCGSYLGDPGLVVTSRAV